MRKVTKFATSLMLATAMISTLVSGAEVNSTSTENVNIFANNTWETWNAPSSWGNGDYYKNTITSTDSSSFVANVATTGWAAVWQYDGNEAPEGVPVLGNCWADNPIATEAFVNESYVVPGETYNLKMTVKNNMKNGGNPTEKNITVVIGNMNYKKGEQCAPYDKDNTYFSKTYTIAANGTINIDENIKINGTNVGLAIYYGPYMYSKNGGTAEGYALAPGTTEDANCEGTIEFTNVALMGKLGTKEEEPAKPTTPAITPQTPTVANTTEPQTSVTKDIKKIKTPTVKVKKVGKKAIKVTWKKVSFAKKYQVKVGKKTYTTKKTSYVVKKLKKGTYKVKVRALKNGAYNASNFSKTKKVKIK